MIISPPQPEYHFFIPIVARRIDWQTVWIDPVNGIGCYISGTLHNSRNDRLVIRSDREEFAGEYPYSITWKFAPNHAMTGTLTIGKTKLKVKNIIWSDEPIEDFA